MNENIETKAPSRWSQYDRQPLYAFSYCNTEVTLLFDLIECLENGLEEAEKLNDPEILLAYYTLKAMIAPSLKHILPYVLSTVKAIIPFNFEKNCCGESQQTTPNFKLITEKFEKIISVFELKDNSQEDAKQFNVKQSKQLTNKEILEYANNVVKDLETLATFYGKRNNRHGICDNEKSEADEGEIGEIGQADSAPVDKVKRELANKVLNTNKQLFKFYNERSNCKRNYEAQPDQQVMIDTDQITNENNLNKITEAIVYLKHVIAYHTFLQYNQENKDLNGSNQHDELSNFNLNEFIDKPLPNFLADLKESFFKELQHELKTKNLDAIIGEIIRRENGIIRANLIQYISSSTVQSPKLEDPRELIKPLIGKIKLEVEKYRKDVEKYNSLTASMIKHFLDEEEIQLSEVGNRDERVGYLSKSLNQFFQWSEKELNDGDAEYEKAINTIIVKVDSLKEYVSDNKKLELDVKLSQLSQLAKTSAISVDSGTSAIKIQSHNQINVSKPNSKQTFSRVAQIPGYYNRIQAIQEIYNKNSLDILTIYEYYSNLEKNLKKQLDDFILNSNCTNEGFRSYIKRYCEDCNVINERLQVNLWHLFYPLFDHLGKLDSNDGLTASHNHHIEGLYDTYARLNCVYDNLSKKFVAKINDFDPLIEEILKMDLKDYRNDFFSNENQQTILKEYFKVVSNRTQSRSTGEICQPSSDVSADFIELLQLYKANLRKLVSFITDQPFVHSIKEIIDDMRAGEKLYEFQYYKTSSAEHLAEFKEHYESLAELFPSDRTIQEYKNELNKYLTDWINLFVKISDDQTELLNTYDLELSRINTIIKQVEQNSYYNNEVLEFGKSLAVIEDEDITGFLQKQKELKKLQVKNHDEMIKFHLTHAIIFMLGVSLCGVVIYNLYYSLFPLTTGLFCLSLAMLATGELLMLEWPLSVIFGSSHSLLTSNLSSPSPPTPLPPGERGEKMNTSTVGEGKKDVSPYSKERGEKMNTSTVEEGEKYVSPDSRERGQGMAKSMEVISASREEKAYSSPLLFAPQIKKADNSQSMINVQSNTVKGQSVCGNGSTHTQNTTQPIKRPYGCCW